MTTITDLLADEIRAKIQAAGIPGIRLIGDEIAAQLIAECLTDRPAENAAGNALMETAARLQIVFNEAKERGTEIQAQYLLNVLAAIGERLWHRTTPPDLGVLHNPEGCADTFPENDR